MTKYLINLVCIIGVAGAAHAGVADLQITADGHAYLVFDGTGNGQLTGYSIKDTSETITFDRVAEGALDGTGEFGTAWASLDSQGGFSGEQVGSHDWFFEGTPLIPSFLGEGNIDGYLERPDDAPVYIGRIIDTGAGTAWDALPIPGGGGTGGAILASDFGVGGRLEFVVFSTSDTASTSAAPVDTGAVGLMAPTSALTTGTTSLLGSDYSETIPATPTTVGAADTHFDAVFSDGAGDATVVDLEIGAAGATVGNVTTTTFGAGDGTIIVNGNVMDIASAVLVQETTAGNNGAFVSGTLSVKAVDGLTTVAVNAVLAEGGTDALGRNGAFGASTLVISEIPGDYDLDGDSDADDIDLMFAAQPPANPNLLFDETNDGVIAATDTDVLVHTLVATGLGNGTQYGDSDLDGTVGFNDFSLLALWYGQAGGWAKGDYDGDTTVGFNDFSLLALYYGQGAPAPAPALAPVAAPEPATMALLALGGVALIKRRRRA